MRISKRGLKHKIGWSFFLQQVTLILFLMEQIGRIYVKKIPSIYHTLIEKCNSLHAVISLVVQLIN